jgi:potassium efflux system protein
LFAAVYIPALVLTCSTVYGEASQYFESVGRISFILAHIWTAYVLRRVINLSDGILSRLIREHPDRIVVRCRYLWYPLVITWPIALVVLASLGYLITAIELSLGLLSTAAFIATGVILYWLALRWFIMRHRKLALAEALERRRARQEAAASEGQPVESGEVVTVDPEDEEGMDLESIGEQTRHLLRLLFALGVAVAVVLFWSETIPLIAALDEIPVPLTGGLTLLGLLQAMLIVLVTYIVVQDLPGLLELALRARASEPGKRHAISTLCQYAATAIGTVLLLGVLDVDWTKFGWIAAGLSVGIGFGLQEVVANLVCGLMLLFESPIRMGDVVTVEGTTGTVTKIGIRATTITNWDRQECVVPNKNLITGTILNWTLTASVTRVTIPVGVAYGTDTEKARQILLDVAADHPRVVDDPAPMATFEAFADSSLTLCLLAYVPDVENRRRTITELHAEVDKRFATAGIEIAFPQQDLHLRSGWDDTRQVEAGGVEAEKEKK